MIKTHAHILRRAAMVDIHVLISKEKRVIMIEIPTTNIPGKANQQVQKCEQKFSLIPVVAILTHF